MEALVQPSSSCPSCAGRSYVRERQGDRAVARVCGCSKSCQRCGGTGHLMVRQSETFSQKVGPKSYEVLAPCGCRLLDKRIERYAEAQIPGILAHADFDGYRCAKEEQDRAKRVVAAFAQSYRKDSSAKGFILSGPVGTGKSHLLAAALSHLILEGAVSARYVEISLLYSTIRRGFQEGKSGGEIIGPLSEVEVLAIDELGKGRGSVFEMETLDELIARRYNAGRTTLFATNYSLAPERGARSAGYQSTEDAKAKMKADELLRDRVGERIYSRLCEMCDFLEFPASSPDHRRTRHEMGTAPRLRGSAR